MAQRVAIVGIGETGHTSRRPDINDGELINEAVTAALDDAQLTIKDIDAVLCGNMEFFEGHYLNDAMLVDYTGSFMKRGHKVNTGGTVGTAQVKSGCTYVASGLSEVALVIGWEKHDEASVTSAIVTFADAGYDRHFYIGALTGMAGVALAYMNRSGATVEHAAMVRAKASECASKNPNAHLRMKLSVEDVLKSRMVVYPMLLHLMCPTSVGACALVLASEERAKKITNKPVWVKDIVTGHREYGTNIFGIDPGFELEMTHTYCARELYTRNHITNPREEVQVFEMYAPDAYSEMAWLEDFLICDKNEGWKLIEKGVTNLEGDFPVCPSGGVLCTNAIGDSGVVRVAEAALQIRGDAGEHQVTREVKQALVSGFGGCYWTDLFLLRKTLD